MPFPVISADSSDIAEQNMSPVTLSQAYATARTITATQAREVSTITQFVTVIRPAVESFTTTKLELLEEESVKLDDIEERVL